MNLPAEANMTDTESTRQEEHYAGQIKGGLRPSMRLVVMGIVHKQAKRSASRLGLIPGALLSLGTGLVGTGVVSTLVHTSKTILSVVWITDGQSKQGKTVRLASPTASGRPRLHGICSFPTPGSNPYHGGISYMVVTVSCPPQGEGEEEEEGDVGLQMTVNFPEKAVRRNYRMAGKWGNCESALSFFPFASGEAFKMEIVCEHQQFRVLVDGQPLCGFTHRVTQLASLTSLRVVGDLQLTKVA